MSDPQEPPPAEPRAEPRAELSVEAVQEDAFTILDLIVILVRRRRIIALTTGAAAAVLLAYNLAAISLPPESPFNRLPDRYTASVTVMVSDDAPDYGSAAASLLSQVPAGGGLADFAGLLATEGSTDANRAQELLLGRSILDALAVQQELVDETSDGGDVLAARRRLRDDLSTDYRIDSGLLEITFDHFYPDRAASGLRFAVERLREKVHGLTIQRVRDRKQFLEERMAAVEQDRADAQEALIAFQTEYGVVNPTAQSESTIQRLTALKTDLYRKEVELHSQIAMLGDNNAGVRRLRSEADTLRTLIGEIERGFDEFQASDPPLNDLPELSVRYLDLATEVGVHDTIHSFLRSQYESVRIEESAKAATFQIVEPVETPRRKSRPRRAMICIIGTLAAGMASVLAAFTLEYFKRAAANPAQRRQLDAIRGEIGRQR